MRTSSITATIDADIQTVWAVVTDNKDYGWRSDLDKIEIINERVFIEYTKSGVQTQFTITDTEPYARYAFYMKNRFFTGHWVGLFKPLEQGRTEITFTEELHICNPFIQLLSYLFLNLKKIQQIYVDDLKKKITRL